MEIDSLLRLVDGPRDGALLRLTLGRLYHAAGDHASAIVHLRRAVEMDREYTAAWKELGRVLAADGQPGPASEALRAGLEAARRGGDKQAEKEMTVFLRRIGRQQDTGGQ